MNWTPLNRLFSTLGSINLLNGSRYWGGAAVPKLEMTPGETSASHRQSLISLGSCVCLSPQCLQHATARFSVQLGFTNKSKYLECRVTLRRFDEKCLTLKNNRRLGHSSAPLTAVRRSAVCSWLPAACSRSAVDAHSSGTRTQALYRLLKDFFFLKRIQENLQYFYSIF